MACHVTGRGDDLVASAGFQQRLRNPPTIAENVISKAARLDLQPSVRCPLPPRRYPLSGEAASGNEASPHVSLIAMLKRLREDIATIRERDPAARGAWEVLTCYPGLHALVLHRLAHACWRAKRRWLARFVSQLARFLTGIEIHPGATVGRRVFIDHGMGVVIGETAEIGDDCTIYQGVTLGGTSLERGAKRHPTLGRGVIVGAGAKVLGGFTVGADAKIGSNAVVVKPVPAGGTAVGNPARVIVPAAGTAAKAGEAKPVPLRSGFCAYGITPNADDPVSLAIHGLIDHAATQTQRIDEIVAALERLGTTLEALNGADAALLDLRRLSAAIEGKVEQG
ncbi:2,3,4,5-tetrahydropyridine-2,6-dicarboxylate N-acetyltransferase [Paraburkholderia gardini]|uniref:serine O-acetyltransferase n=2 Tax=Paraburkholderia gardini TaxID=2823469 RepID=A0ABM8U2K9_9BURK|nr:2,3,4,5-tetrahydropyridine-2,6-dicarboxylate N-acetyltransferase [Paraburkholderia gardini]CAG4896247.1 2,3,4,5-tetrahydropyridine-2,6-dicarboxylate N-acetyltransferase [Paraburkholderia gardini]